MAYPMSAGDVIQINLMHTLNSQVVETTWHYRLTASGTDGAAVIDFMLLDFESSVWNILRAGLSTSLLATRILGQRVYPIRNVARVLTPTNTTGALASTAAPTGVAVVLRRKTQLAGKKFRGRVYMPGIATADLTASQLSLAWQIANTTNWQSLPPLGILQTAFIGAEPIVWSRLAPTRQTVITDGQVDPVLRYQRRREIGVGI